MTRATINDYLYCVLLSLPWLAIQSIWQTEFGTVTDTMISYGLPKDSAGIIWIFGPITGFFTAPLVGAYSDKCTSSWGRRRPFIIVGLLSTVISSLLFSGSAYISSQGLKVFLGYISFIALDITINVMQTPVRALASDLAPAHMQNTVQLMASMFQGLGSVLGFYVQKALPTGYPLIELFGIIMAINILVVMAVVLLIKEPIHVPTRNTSTTSIMAPFVTVFKNVLAMDVKMMVVCAVEFCSWWALFFWWTASATWWKLTVYDGCIAVGENDPNCLKDSVGAVNAKSGQDDYDSTGIYANMIQILISLGLGLLVLTGIVKRVKILYSLGLAVGAVFLILLKFGPKSVGFAWVTTLAMPIAIAVIQAFPFAIVGSYNKHNDGQDTGVQMGLLNLFICLPQVLVTVITKGIQIDDTNSLFISGVFLGIGAILALFITEVNNNPAPKYEDGEKTKA